MPCDNYIVEWVRHCFNLATMACDTACMQILTLFQSEDMHICFDVYSLFYYYAYERRLEGPVRPKKSSGHNL